MTAHLSINLTWFEDAELHTVLWLKWLLVPGSCCWLWLCGSLFKGGGKQFGPETEVSLCWTEATGSGLCLGSCVCTEVLLEPTEGLTLVLLACPSLWARLSKAFRLFSSIIRCCSAVSWLDMLTARGYLADIGYNLRHPTSAKRWSV